MRLLSVVTALVVIVYVNAGSGSTAVPAGFDCECDECSDVNCTAPQVCRIQGQNGGAFTATCINIPSSSNPIHWLTGGNPCGIGSPAVGNDDRLLRCTSNAGVCPAGTTCTQVGTSSARVCCQDFGTCEKEGVCPATDFDPCSLLDDCAEDGDCPGTHKCCDTTGCTEKHCVASGFAG